MEKGKGRFLYMLTPKSNNELSRQRYRWRRVLRLSILLLCAAYFILLDDRKMLPTWRRPLGVAFTEKEEWLHEVAGLMGELYQTLQKMGYLKENAVVYPPHRNPSINTTLASRLSLSDESISFLQMLPYVVSSPGPFVRTWRNSPNETVSSATWWKGYGGPNSLLLGTTFADMRDDSVMRASREAWSSYQMTDFDIEYAYGPKYQKDREMDNEPPGLDCHQVILTGGVYGGSNRDGSLILDLLSRNIYTVGHEAVPWEDYNDGSSESRGSIDPVTKGLLAEGAKPVLNHNLRSDFRMYASRPAIEVLRDYINRFRTLEWIPGYIEDSSDHRKNGASYDCYPRDAYRELYLQHGWPNSFNRSAFEVSRRAWETENRSLYKALEPIRSLQNLEWQRTNDIEVIESWRADLADLETLDPNIRTRLYDPRSRKYRGRTKEETVEVIEYRSGLLKDVEKQIVEVRKQADALSEKDKAHGETIIAKYGNNFMSDPWEILVFDEQ